VSLHELGLYQLFLLEYFTHFYNLTELLNSKGLTVYRVIFYYVYNTHVGQPYSQDLGTYWPHSSRLIVDI